MRAIIALKSDGDVRKSRAVPNMRLVYGGAAGRHFALSYRATTRMVGKQEVIQKRASRRSLLRFPVAHDVSSTDVLEADFWPEITSDLPCVTQPCPQIIEHLIRDVNPKWFH